MKKIWFVSHYSVPPKYEMRIKTQMYARYLQEKGYECTIFSASTIHNTDINLVAKKEKFKEVYYGDLHFIHIRCRLYSNLIQRIFNLRDFSKGFYRLAKKMKKPDVIVADCNCLNYKPLIKFAKRYKIKLFLDIRDLWPLSIVEYMNVSSRSLVIKYLYHQEHNMYRKADGIIFTMEGGREYLKDRGWTDIPNNKVFHINNGIDLISFNNNKNDFCYQDDDLNNNKLFKAIYVGAIRKVNDLKVLCDAALLLKEEIPMLKIIVFGEGDEKDYLIDYCKENNISNVSFKGFVEKKYIPSILSRGDINILNYQVTNVIKYGACQNKLFDYMASGKFTICNARGNYNLIERYNCGIVTDKYDAVSTANAIKKAYSMGEDRKKLGLNAIEAVKKYDYRVLTEILLNIIEKGAN